MPTLDLTPTAARLSDIGWAVLVNAIVLLGVVAFGWPAGNVFALFIAENALVGIVTLAMLFRQAEVGTALFFLMHFGIFTTVHAVFTSIIALALGLQFTLWTLWFPLAMLVLRYAVQAVRVLRIPRGVVDTGKAFWLAYPRVIVLHLSIFPGMFFALQRTGVPIRTSGPGIDWLPQDLPLTGAQFAVAILLVLKTIVDVVVTQRIPISGAVKADSA